MLRFLRFLLEICMFLLKQCFHFCLLRFFDKVCVIESVKMLENDCDKVESLLQSEKRLDRDRGVVHLKTLLKSSTSDTAAKDLLIRFYEKLLSSNDSTPWEVIHGCLLGLKCIMQGLTQKEDESVVLSDPILEFLLMFSLKMLSHTEVRVRTQSGEFLGALCKHKGSDVYASSSGILLKLLRSDLDREIESDKNSQQDAENTPTTIGTGAVNIFHESAGWRHLETSMKCLQCMIESCGKSFNPFITQELLDLLFSALTHTNRFVRETGFNVCAAIVKCGQIDATTISDSVVKHGSQFSKFFAKGLADNWSQVRLASSIAVRNFLMSITDLEEREKYFPELVPRMCLNRYYIAEGVRLYSQETWKQILQGNGKAVIENHISSVVQYYIEATKADNHAVREAACACISELATKIKPEAVCNYVPLLLDALLECFQDDSWPVRDAACVACGNFILCFPTESLMKRDLLYSLFLGNLKDPIPSVRQGAGVALAKYTKVYADDVLSVVLKEIRNGLEDVSKQPENSGKHTGLDKGPAQFGVVKNLHEVSDPKHTDQQMYSCGSLAPKMGRGNRGGCSDCHFRRPSEPWECSDGCIYLIAELSAYFPQEICSLLPNILKSLSHKHFSQHLVLLETVCKQLPTIATRLGKRTFKMHVESFFDSIFYGLTCDVQLTVAAAEDCLTKLAKFLGASILRGRIENYNPHYLEQYDRAIMHTGNVCHSPLYLSGKQSPLF